MTATQDRPLQYKGYIPGLDVLRGLAIALVLIYHGADGTIPWATTHGGWRAFLLATNFGSSGVQLFFVLSGFLITGILLDTVGKPDYYRKFYVRRALRILPAYCLLLAVLRMLHVIDWRFVLAALLYVANMARLVGSHGREYGALWSLAVEEQFYLIWPWIVRRLSLSTLTRCIAGYMAFDLLLRVVSIQVFHSTSYIYKLWGHAEMLLWGALFAVLVRRGLLTARNITRYILLLSGCAVIAMANDVAMQVGAVHLAVDYALYQLPFIFAYGALLLLVLKYNGVTTPFSALGRVLIFFGYSSYGLYLVHPLIFGMVEKHVQGTVLQASSARPWPVLVNTCIGVFISVVIAWLSRRFFEEPFLRRKDRLVPYNKVGVNERPEGEAIPEAAPVFVEKRSEVA